MALKKCPECKDEISEEATTCPKCGKKDPFSIDSKNKAGGCLMFILMIFGITIYFYTSGPSNTIEVEKQTYKGQWGIKSSSATIKCVGTTATIIIDSVEYALNGRARQKFPAIKEELHIKSEYGFNVPVSDFIATAQSIETCTI